MLSQTAETVKTAKAVMRASLPPLNSTPLSDILTQEPSKQLRDGRLVDLLPVVFSSLAPVVVASLVAVLLVVVVAMVVVVVVVVVTSDMTSRACQKPRLCTIGGFQTVARVLSEDCIPRPPSPTSF